MKHRQDQNTQKIRKWINVNPRANCKLLNKFLEGKGCSPHGITHALCGKDFSKVRKEIVSKFQIK